MLVLKRFQGESLIIAGEVEIRILEIRGKTRKTVILGVEAPRDCSVDRKEVWEEKRKQADDK